MIYIGTSGYSYDDWQGVFYPEGIKSSGYLEYYAEKFNTVEVNFTYYRLPYKKVFESMNRRTPDDFKFFVKANGEMTHKYKNNEDSFEKFKYGIEPVVNSGKLSGILAQFPWAFKNEEKNNEYLGKFKENMKDYELVYEFRNKSWIQEKTFNWLKDNNIGFCCVDEPDIPSLPPRIAVSTSMIGYLRFHSRDASKWWSKGSKERYNYLYTEDEIMEWVPKIKKLSLDTSDLYIYFNNCHMGKAITNAVQIENLLKDY